MNFMRWFSNPVSGSKRHSSTFSAFSEKIAKLMPLPSHVAPRGYEYPGYISETGFLACACAFSWRNTLYLNE